MTPDRQAEINYQSGLQVRSGSFINTLTDTLSRLAERYLPDPFVLVILLTLVAFIGAMWLGHRSPWAVAGYWSDGLWGFLSFTMQMSFMVVTGYAFAVSPPLSRVLSHIATRVSGPKQAVAVCALVGAVGGYINWGFGLIIAALMAKELAKKVPNVHHPLLIYSAYAGWVLYGLGLSATIPITLATPANPFQAAIGGVIPLTHTVFRAGVVIDALLLAILVPVVQACCHPARALQASLEQVSVSVDAAQSRGARTVAERLERAWLLSVVLAMLCAVYVYRHFVSGGGMDINTLNVLFLCLGLLMHWTPASYVVAVTEGVRSVAGILIQYPLYAGIMGILKGAGLDQQIASGLAHVASAHTLPFWGLITSFVLNFFAPSSGGHWAIQGPFMIEAAHRLGADMGATAMAVQMGCAWQDVLQPFWLLPMLAITGVKLRSVLGYALLPFVMVGIVFITTVLLW